ncbi:hypothetical protein DL89DRAFT_318238 [Linderina pennispora]|uniref:Uncharacterized protein n=1 Tax=Linderina pennispora TaxID=61395 RepID=A0A1Y1W500_9FUNG|nr:uncharacterized protein DL89DRAFT_318238 [Linderina pennispora]ORX68472.1 hypothetical protein DL89DRAFT_318238 [Linderina pennispora]
MSFGTPATAHIMSASRQPRFRIEIINVSDMDSPSPDESRSNSPLPTTANQGDFRSLSTLVETLDSLIHTANTKAMEIRRRTSILVQELPNIPTDADLDSAELENEVEAFLTLRQQIKQKMETLNNAMDSCVAGAMDEYRLERRRILEVQERLKRAQEMDRQRRGGRRTVIVGEQRQRNLRMLCDYIASLALSDGNNTESPS